MCPKVMAWSPSHGRPFDNGLFPLNEGTMLTLDQTGMVEGYRITHSKRSGQLWTERVLRCPSSSWKRPGRLGGRAEDGRGARLVALMGDVGREGGNLCPVPMPQLLARVTPEAHFELDDPTVQNFILDRVNFGVPAPSSKAPITGEIEEIVADQHDVLVGFKEGPVMTLPPTARLKPWLKVGVVVQVGTVVADMLPKVRYNWDQLMASSQAERLVEDYLDGLMAMGQVPLEIIPEDFRMTPSHGGYVLEVLAEAKASRRPVLTAGLDAHTPYGALSFGDSVAV
jgi:hypothetical protein